MTDTQRILMERDGLTAEEAKELMNEAREALMDGDFEAIEIISDLKMTTYST